MGWLNSEKPPDRWNAAYFKMFVERLRTAVNFLNGENFPDGVSGSVLTNRSVALNTKVTGYGGLALYEDFFTLMQSTTINATAPTVFGSAVLFSPIVSTLANVYLEVTCSAADESYPCTVEVHDPDGALLSESVTSTTFSRREFLIPKEALPDVACTFVFKAYVDNNAYPLTILSARLILKLTELSI